MPLARELRPTRPAFLGLTTSTIRKVGAAYWLCIGVWHEQQQSKSLKIGRLGRKFGRRRPLKSDLPQLGVVSYSSRGAGPAFRPPKVGRRPFAFTAADYFTARSAYLRKDAKMRVMGLGRWIAVACLGLGMGTGCNRPAGVGEQHASGAVAVIDLDAIAQRLGSDKQIVDAIASRQSSLSQQLVDLAKSYNAQIAEKQKTLVEASPEKSEVTVANWQKQANENLNKVKQQAQADLQRHQAQLIAQFREQIKPAARRVAQKRGLSVIVTKNDNILYDFSPQSDITDEVIADLISSSAAASAAAAKPLQTAAAPAAGAETPAK
jgi:Skp family chaperone for outer membrane proteins